MYTLFGICLRAGSCLARTTDNPTLEAYKTIVSSVPLRLDLNTASRLILNGTLFGKKNDDNSTNGPGAIIGGGLLWALRKV